MRREFLTNLIIKKILLTIAIYNETGSKREIIEGTGTRSITDGKTGNNGMQMILFEVVILHKGIYEGQIKRPKFLKNPPGRIG